MKKKYLSLLMGLGICFIGFGCDHKKTDDNLEVMGYVNDEPIYVKEFEKNIALKMKQNPLLKMTEAKRDEQLDLVIEKKLILQEAVKQGLARDAEFIDMIKVFWEQALVRKFLDYKKEEIRQQIVVTDEEIKNYYNHLGTQVMFKVFSSQDKSERDDFYQSIKKQKNMDFVPWSFIGPVHYVEINAEVLLNVFHAPVGEVNVEDHENQYYIIVVMERKEVMKQSLEILKLEVNRHIMDLKEKQIFDLWIKEEKNQADINILRK